MIAIDTSFLIESLTGPRLAAGSLRQLLESGKRLVIPSVVLYEWRRGPRFNEEIRLQEALFPATEALPFGFREAELAARIYRGLAAQGRRPRGREIDIAIAATAMVADAELLTLNRADFVDIPGLRLVAGFGP